jgi:tetratricopeptide (TPR) repeat protein
MAQKQKFSPAHEVAAAIDDAESLINVGSYDDAWATLLQAEEVAQCAGISSPLPFLHWSLSVAADYRADPHNAVKHVMIALRADPCSPPIRESHRIIADRVRATFDNLDAADAKLSIFYGLLRELGVADAAATMRYSKSAALHGEYDVALTSAQHAVEAEPPTAERLHYLAHLLAWAGRHEEARERRREAEVVAMTFSCRKAQA